MKIQPQTTHPHYNLFNEDQILTENLHILKGYGAKERIKEFPNKIWELQRLNKLLKSCET